MDDYENYEKECKKIRKANERLLNQFEVSLKSSRTGLSEKTINNHLSNIDFYVNEYLLYEDATEAKDGVVYVDMFLGYLVHQKGNVGKSVKHQGQRNEPKKVLHFHA